MKKILFIVALFFCLKANAQYRLFGNGGYNLRSNAFTFLGTSGTDSIARIDSLKVKLFKPILPGVYTTATAPAASLFPGYIIVNSDSTNKPQYSDGTNWINLPGTGGGGGGSGVTTFNTRSGAVTLLAADVSGVGGFLNGLNAFGANSTIGNSDNFALSIRTNNTERIGISNAGVVLMPAGTLNIGTTGNATINLISSAGSTRGTIGLSSNNPQVNSATGTLFLSIGGTNMATLNSTGLFLRGGSGATASLEILAGTTAIAPFRLNSGPLLTTPLAGVEEFLTDKRYTTITTGAARKEYALWDATGTVGRIPFQTTNNRLLDDAGLSWDNSTKILQFSGTSSLFPGIIRDGASIQVKLADNSANANLKVLDQAYDPTTFDGNDEVPTKNALRDEIESMRYRPYSQTAQLGANTSDATPSNMSVVYGLTTLPNNSAGWVKVTLTGNGSSGASTHNIHGIKYYSFHKSGGTLTLDAADVIVADKKGASVSTATWQLTIASNQPVLEVTGVTAITMVWTAALEIQVVIEN